MGLDESTNSAGGQEQAAPVGGPRCIPAGAALPTAPSAWRTSIDLLRQIQESPAHPRWETFYRRYAPLVLSFARQRGCDRSQAEDVLQETMMRLMRALPTFDYDPGRGHFRAYLLKIVQNIVWTELSRSSRKRELETAAADTMLAAAGNIQRDWDLAWKKNTALLALEAVSTRVSPTTYESFVLYALENVPAEQVAARLGLDKNAVYQHRNRVIRLLGEEVARLVEQEEQGYVACR